MAKFNEVQKRKRAAKADRKRVIHGDRVTGKLKNKPQSLSVSGKRKRKLLKKWRRDHGFVLDWQKDQKEVMEQGLITMEDVEMVAAEADVGTYEDGGKTPKKFSVKKSLKLKKLNRKGKKKKSGKPTAEASADTMVE